MSFFEDRIVPITFPIFMRIWTLVFLSIAASSAAAQQSKEHENQYPAWFGLTPLDTPTCTDPTEWKIYEQRENDLRVARQGFYWGLGGLISALAFDKMDKRPLRTVGYMVLGAGWSTWLGVLGKSASVNAGLSDKQSGSARNHRERLFRASTQGAVGEAANLHLIPDGLYIHPLYNDVNGATDKFLTASAKAGYMHSFEDVDWESVGYWRFLTPSFSPEFEAEVLSAPVGRYADWGEWKNSMSQEIDFGSVVFRNQFSIGFNDIGNKGGRDVHRAIHKLTRNSLDNLDYTNQPSGRFLSLGLETGIGGRSSREDAARVSGLLSLQVESSKVLTETGVKLNIHNVIVPAYWEHGLELRILRQIRSEIYSELMPWRYEASFGVRLFRNFTPTVKYVSAYLVGDSVGQTYFDLLHFNFEL